MYNHWSDGICRDWILNTCHDGCPHRGYAIPSPKREWRSVLSGTISFDDLHLLHTICITPVHCYCVAEKKKTALINFIRGTASRFGSQMAVNSVKATLLWVSVGSGTSHYMNQCWLLTSEVLWHSQDNRFTASSEATFLCNKFQYWYFSNYCHVSQAPLSYRIPHMFELHMG